MVRRRPNIVSARLTAVVRLVGSGKERTERDDDDATEVLPISKASGHPGRQADHQGEGVQERSRRFGRQRAVCGDVHAVAARGTVPATEGEIGEVAALQKAYEKKVRDTYSDIQGEKFLATQCGFTMDRIPHFPKPTGDEKVAIQYWKGVGTLGTAISKYVSPARAPRTACCPGDCRAPGGSP